jgi:hypothetical protein
LRRCVVVTVICLALTVLVAGCSKAGQHDAQNSNPATNPTLDPLAYGAGHGPPVPEYNQLLEDNTGNTSWVEASVGGVVARHPADDTEWAVRFDPGDYFAGFDGVPYVRVTHLATGKTRIYSLLTGELMLCTDRSAVLAAPTADLVADQGVPVDCSPKDLAPGEQAVFAHIKITGRYKYYLGPANSPMKTVPGWTETPVPPEWKWNPSAGGPFVAVTYRGFGAVTIKVKNYSGGTRSMIVSGPGGIFGDPISACQIQDISNNGTYTCTPSLAQGQYSYLRWWAISGSNESDGKVDYD